MSGKLYEEITEFVVAERDLPPPKHGPQSRALCDAVCALSIAIVLY